jgi:hypothetical protein
MMSARRVGASSGIVGALLLAAYFIAPALLGWPYAGATPATIAAYATTHAALFYAGAWLQVTGTTLCVVFFLSLVLLSAPTAGLADQVAVLGAGLLVATVVVEAAFLVAVPVAAGSGDPATAMTMFTLSNGVFVRVFPLAPASATLIAVGLVLRRSGVLGARLATAALALGAAFEIAGLVAIVSPAGVVGGAILSVGQGLWVVVAAVSLWQAGAPRRAGEQARWMPGTRPDHPREEGVAR